MDTCYIYLRKLSIYFNRAVPLDQYRSCWIQNLTYGSGEWSGFDPCLTYCVHWKTRNAKLARKSRADSRPDTGRNWNPVLPKYKKQSQHKISRFNACIFRCSMIWDNWCLFILLFLVELVTTPCLNFLFILYCISGIYILIIEIYRCQILIFVSKRRFSSLGNRLLAACVAYLFFLPAKTFKSIWFFNLLILRVPDEGFSRYESCVLN